MPAERVVVGQKMLMESGHGSTMKHHRGEVSEHGAFDIVAQEHGLSIGHFHQRGVGCLLLDDRAGLDETERAAHHHREEGVRATVGLNDFLVQFLKTNIFAFALILECRPMAVGKRHREIIWHALGHTGLADLICDPIQDNELAVEPFAGADTRIAVLEQLADGGGAFQQAWYQ